LAKCLMLTDRWEEAEPLCREATGLWTEDFGPGSVQRANALAYVGYVRLRHRRYVEAEPLLRECLAIREQKEAGAWPMYSAKSMLGEALVGLSKYAEAEPLLLEGFDGMKKTHWSDHANWLPTIVQRLVQLYEAWGKPDEAAKWRRVLEGHQKQKREMEKS
jgi:eukaryotic-like serine/threonine-protein kinase